MNPMGKIVHLTSVHPAFDNRILNKECYSAAQAGYTVKLIAPHHKNEVVRGVQIIALPQEKKRLRRVFLNTTRIYQEALKENADLFHFHDPELIFVGLLLRANGKRVIYDVHEDVPRNVLARSYLTPALRNILSWLMERVERVAANRFTALIAATPTIGERFQELNSYTEVINNFAWKNELSQPKTISWKERPNTIGYIGACTRARGAVEMVRAMEFVDPALRATLEIGGHFGPPSLQTQLAELPGWAHVNFRGYLDRLSVGELLGMVRVGLVVLHPEPTYVNSQPTKLFEYMAAGLPTIASDFPFWRSLIGDAGCVLFVNPLKPEEIGQAIEYSLKNSGEMEEMGQRGRELVIESYNWESERQKLLRLYAQLLNSNL